MTCLDRWRGEKILRRYIIYLILSFADPSLENSSVYLKALPAPTFISSAIADLCIYRVHKSIDTTMMTASHVIFILMLFHHITQGLFQKGITRVSLSSCIDPIFMSITRH